MKRKTKQALAALLSATLLAAAGCGQQESSESTSTETTAAAEASTAAAAVTTEAAAEENQMQTLLAALPEKESDDAYRTTYEIFVREFYDSDGDGTGDLKGVEEQLPYIHEEMGFDEIWLMPVCPSPSYHGYDVTDYEDINPDYGTMEDFQSLLSACHEKNVRVLLDLVVNHTSSEHPWFLEAAEYLKGLGEDAEPDESVCPYVGYYNFTREAADGYAQLPGTSWYYEARFTDSMPDLNLDNEAVRDEIRDIMQFWLDLGVDGFRLDATTSYYTDSSEDTIAFLQFLNDTAKEIHPDAYLVGEAWTDQGTYAEYYKSGIDSFFDFAFSGSEGSIAKLARSRMSAKTFGESLEKEEALYAGYNENYINAPFYTNHDMARSAGYFTGDAEPCVKLAGALNLLMQGNAFVYYGEELGMTGSGKDENKRAPMYWSAEESAEGMCTPPENMDTFEMKFPSYEEQKDDPTSIVNYFKTAVHIRDAFPALKKGDTVVNGTLSDDDILAFTRSYEGEESVLVVLNAGEEEKTVELTGDAAAYTNLRAVLLTDENEVTEDGSALTLPPKAIAVLTEE